MPDPIGNQLNQARQHEQAGRLGEAEQIYRRILAENPNFAPALLHLGHLAWRVKRYEDAIGLIHRAVQLDPTNAAAWSDLASVLKDANRPGDAEMAARRAIAIQPRCVEAYN